ncbi:Shedu anti-phage system protein SduA domain-containing protein [Methylorubrum sp. SL192]|uniref:Shedu anti-phage system protein SduA domain-containing protein n=1 Tax=Methylorubrum sp. SL192 TaxID=2995167 RepID=UPI0022728298|nr:Shedu anti-phage system protein SduA domain-containing protein [Methylorubrum sp. SL192]MCY1642123.1 DUF4263 domain-containing protein [Methylorubrum sp. SL192]
MANYYAEMFAHLLSAVQDGGRAARDHITEIAVNGDGLDEILPAYASLAAWRQDGFAEIVRIALSGDSVKIKSAALTVLSAIAEKGCVPPSIMIGEELARIVNIKLSDEDRPDARRALTSMVMQIPTEDLIIPISQSFIHYAMGGTDAPYILTSAISSKWLKFGPAVLDRFEEMLVTDADNEPAFQAFFTAYPQMLDPMVVRAWSQPDLHGAEEPDFVLQRADDTYLVVEIETPGKLLIRQDGQLAAEATHAEKQVNDYATFLNERIGEARRVFPNYRPADKMAVIGLQRSLTDVQARALSATNEARHKLVTVGFDWLLDRARRVLQNLSEGEIQIVERGRMI